MTDQWKQEIIRAFWIAAAVAVIALVVNWVRTPILFALAENDKISRATAYDHRGVFLNDDWSHHGRPEEQGSTVNVDIVGNGSGDENGDGSEGDNGEDDPGDHEIQDYLIIDVMQAKMLSDTGNCVFIDSRSLEEYKAGHIPGAIHWPHEEFDEYHEKYRDMISYDTCLIIYCENETCDYSADVATGLVIEYYQTVYRLEVGFDEWFISLYPIVEGPEPE